jgi:hypothetical protein
MTVAPHTVTDRTVLDEEHGAAGAGVFRLEQAWRHGDIAICRWEVAIDRWAAEYGHDERDRGNPP